MNRTECNFGEARPQWAGRKRRPPLKFCAPEIPCLPQGITPVMGVWGKAVIGERSSPLRRPPASFGSFSTRKRNSPIRAKPCKTARRVVAPYRVSKNRKSGGVLLTKSVPSSPPHPAPSGPPSPQGEGFWRGSTSHPPGEGLKRADCKIPAVKNRNQPLSSSSFCFSSPSMRPSSTSASFRFWLPSF